jgi:hypothetical protein
MNMNISTLLEILTSIRHEWIYADLIIAKIKSANLQSEDITNISELITESLESIEDEILQTKMKNIFFQISLIHLEE